MDRKEIIQQLKDKRYSFRQIGKLLGISRQRVHQIFSGYNSYKPKPTKWENYPQLKYLNGKDKLAERVRIRDNHICQICGKIWQEGQRRFDVHHTNEKNENCYTSANYKRFDEMITLCHKCHLNLFHIRKKMRKDYLST